MASSIAKVIALPGKHAPQRFPSFPALERTAVMGFNASIPYTVGVGDTHVFLARSPVYPLWGERPGYEGGAFTAQCYGVSYEMTNLEEYGHLVYASVGPYAVTGTWCNTNSTGNSTPAISAGAASVLSKALIGIDSGTGDLPWVYVPKSSWILLSIGNMGLSTPMETTVTLERWVAPGEVQGFTYRFNLDAAGGSSGGNKYVSTQNQWLRVKSISIESGPLPVSTGPVVSLGAALSEAPPTYTPNSTYGTWSPGVVLTTEKFLLPLTISPEYDNSIIPWQSTRLNAVSALFTNTTKVLAKEGTVLWGRLSPSHTAPWIVTKSLIEAIHPAEKAFLNLEQGTYAYNPPSTDLTDFKNHTYASTYTRSNSSSDNLPVYRLDSTAYVCHAFFTDPDGDTSLAINCDYHVEFRNSSTLFQIGIASLPIEALHTAQLALIRAGFFFSNSEHTGLISKIISGLASLHPLLSVAAPLASGLLTSSSIAVSKRSRAPRPTAATRSGMLPPRVTNRRRTQKTKPKTVSRSKKTVSKALAAMDRIMARGGKPARGTR